MRILLIAYEFPPSPSPSALRWSYLVRELAMQGHEVHVLAPRLAGDAGNLPPLPVGVNVHRTFAGPLMGLVHALSRRRRTTTDNGGSAALPVHGRLNWKGRLFEALQQGVGHVLFPDIRREWNPWARRALGRLLPKLRPDIVVASHEPASVLELGLWAAAKGYPWVADLGDPINAPYTPSRWRSRAMALERRVAASANHVVLTTRGAELQLAAQVGPTLRSSVLPQGFDDRAPVDPSGDSGLFDATRLELVYTGRFYAFRRPDALLAAVVASEGVRLTIAAPSVPENCQRLANQYPDKVRLCGALPHRQALALQRGGDLLINIGNQALSAQIPGKLFEYLGAGRPILHLLAGDDDPAVHFFDDVAAGWTCANESGAIQSTLQRLRDVRLAEGRLPLPSGEGLHDIAQYGWSRLGVRLEAVLHAAMETNRVEAIGGLPHAMHIHH